MQECWIIGVSEFLLFGGVGGGGREWETFGPLLSWPWFVPPCKPHLCKTLRNLPRSYKILKENPECSTLASTQSLYEHAQYSSQLKSFLVSSVEILCGQRNSYSLLYSSQVHTDVQATDYCVVYCFCHPDEWM